jgi:phospholipid/cholesterol/gamma-HCH transport system substrate-binding protein
MRRQGPIQSIASSPTMVGAITTLIIVVAVFLAYNANNGLPFVPTYRVSMLIPNAARLTHDNEVRIGGTRVGVVESIQPVEATRSGKVVDNPDQVAARERNGSCCVAAEMTLKLDKGDSPIPRDSIFRIRYKSTFGLKYVEIVRGTGRPAPQGYVFNGLNDQGTCALPVDLATFSKTEAKTSKDGCFQRQTEFDAIADTFNQSTRSAARQDLIGHGDAFAARGASLNEAINRLGPLFRDAKPVAKVLADPSTELERFITSLAQAARVVVPVAAQQSDLFTQGAITFDAISSNPVDLRDTIRNGPPLLRQGTPELRRQRPFLADFATLARRLRPGVQQLRLALPDLESAIRVGTPVLARSVGTAHRLQRVFVQLLRTVRRPDAKEALNRLKETLGQARPLTSYVVPAQTVCNYWNYFFGYFSNALSQRDQFGTVFRQIGIGTPLGPSTISLPGLGDLTVPGQVAAPLGGYSGIQSNGRDFSPTDPNGGTFNPFSDPIAEGHPYGPTGQKNADCQAGQSGYFYGDLRIPGQPPSNPAEGIPDIPGSRGPTTVYTEQNGTRILKNTRIASHQLTSQDKHPR